MNDHPTSEQLRARAEWYYCLSRAFVTPEEPQALSALAQALPGDLAELAATLGYDIEAPLAGYREAIAGLPDNEALLVLYSGLFLAPPRDLQINVAIYLDGALNGGSVAAMEDLYRTCGVERDDEFHDLSDHVAVQLEFIAYLYLKQAECLDEAADFELPATAGEFLHDFVRRWLPRFVADLDRVTAERGLAANPYLWLARLLAVAVAADAMPPDLGERDARAARAIAKARHDRARHEIGPEDLEVIARKLREKGLSTDHLAIAPEKRDEALGLTKKTPPVARPSRRPG